MDKKANLWRERLKAEIHASGIGYLEIAARAGRGRNFVYQLLDGKSPRIDNLLSVCEAIDLDTVYIMTGVRLDDELMELLNLFNQMTDKQRKKLLEHLHTMLPNGSHPENQ